MQDTSTEPPLLRVIEWYSGIGGMAAGLQRWAQDGERQAATRHQARRPSSLVRPRPQHRVVRAYDINAEANRVYAANWHNRDDGGGDDGDGGNDDGDDTDTSRTSGSRTRTGDDSRANTPCGDSPPPRPPPRPRGCAPTTRSIEHVTARELEGAADVWTLSPPCQPFTRGGREADDEDPRSRSLISLMRILEELKDPPMWIVLENVKNFELSRTRTAVVRALRNQRHHRYRVRECLASPLEVGIPNHRLRYYLVAWRAEGGGERTAGGGGMVVRASTLASNNTLRRACSAAPAREAVVVVVVAPEVAAEAPLAVETVGTVETEVVVTVGTGTVEMAMAPVAVAEATAPIQ